MTSVFRNPAPRLKTNFWWNISTSAVVSLFSLILDFLLPSAVIGRLVQEPGDEGKAYRTQLPAEEDIPLDLTKIIQDCWQEEPGRRPEFSQVKKKLKALNKDGYVVGVSEV